MNLPIKRIVLLAALSSAALAPRTFAVTDAEAASGRALVKKYADSIISVEAVATITITVGDHAQPPRENKVEANGTVISPTGLTVTDLSAIDPHGSIEAMANARGMSQKIEVGETEFKEVKLRLANNTEVPAVIVLKDPDLNLIFIAPLSDATTPKREFPYVSLDKSATGELLGNFFFVTRATKSLQRIVGIVEKPRRMYLMSDHALGVPIFDGSGLVLGISTQYLENGRPLGLVVLTSADVAELAKQAAAVKPEDKVEKQDKPDATSKPVAPDTTAKPATPAAQPPATPAAQPPATATQPPAKP
jgi:hypothetical protein